MEKPKTDDPKEYHKPWFEEPGRPQTKPIKHTGLRENAVVKAVRNGATREVAAAAAGIAPSTLYDWLNRYMEFSERIHRASADAEIEAIEALKRHFPNSVKAITYMLDKRYGWERKQQEHDDRHHVLELIVPDGSEAITVDSDDPDLAEPGVAADIEAGTGDA